MRLVWAAGEDEEDGGGAGGPTDQPAVGSVTVVPSSRAPVIPYFFGLHSRASFWASEIWAGVIILATISRFLSAHSHKRSFRRRVIPVFHRGVDRIWVMATKFVC